MAKSAGKVQQKLIGFVLAKVQGHAVSFEDLNTENPRQWPDLKESQKNT